MKILSQVTFLKLVASNKKFELNEFFYIENQFFYMIPQNKKIEIKHPNLFYVFLKSEGII